MKTSRPVDARLLADGEDPGLQSELRGEYTRLYGGYHEHSARFDPVYRISEGPGAVAIQVSHRQYHRVVVQIEGRGPNDAVVVQTLAVGVQACRPGGDWRTGARARTPLERLRYNPSVPTRCSLLGGSEERPSESAESSGAAGIG
eukprot:scaffold16607_cov46-Phaeocystis_antarctica.AAC.1